MTDQSRTNVLTHAASLASRYLDTVNDRPVCATATADELRRALGGPLAEHGGDPRAILDALASAAATGTLASQGGRYFGFVIGGSLPVATGADWLVSAWDQNSALYASSPLVAIVEEIAAAWLCDLVGLPSDASVGFVTGCQMANFTALAAARHHVLRGAGWDVEANGLNGAPSIDVVVSDESHYTIFMALRLLGLGAGTARRVPTDAQGRMRADDLERMLAETTGPCIVCAQAGNVNTGAFDPIADISAIARARGAWLHVDGAFGLWAKASPALQSLAAGCEEADSIATDAHKWLNVPYDCGIVFSRHSDAHRAACSLAAAYIVANAVERDAHEFVPEESRRGRGVPVYAALRFLGRKGLADLVDRCCGLARRIASHLSADPRVRVLNDVVLNQVLIRIDDGRDRGDAITKAVVAAVQQDGTCWLGGTTWHGMAAMRISISNWSTSNEDVDRSAHAILAVIDRVSSLG